MSNQSLPDLDVLNIGPYALTSGLGFDLVIKVFWERDRDCHGGYRLFRMPVPMIGHFLPSIFSAI